MAYHKDKTAAVIGLGKLGAPLLAVLSQHFKVVGVDADPAIGAALRDGKQVYYEADVDRLLTKYRRRYRIAATIDEALDEASVIFIVIATPSTPEGKFDCTQIAAACRQIGYSPHLKPHHLIVVVSTVLPTQTETEILPALQAGGKQAGRDFDLCYNPSFIALGSVVRNIQSPDLLLIGERIEGSSAGDRLEALHRKLCTNRPPVMRMNFINAEVTKLALNSFVTTKISYANMIARLCEKLPGADSSVVLSTIGVDRRVGSAYFQGAIGYGGPCFPRDNLALAAIAGEAGADASLVAGVHDFNERQPGYLYSLIAAQLTPQDSIGMLGVTYKPDTHSIEHSQAWQVLAMFAAQRQDVGFYDPQAITDPPPATIRRFSSAAECAAHSSVVIIGTCWAQFRDISSVLNKGKVRCVIDLWNVVPRTALREDIILIQAGKGTT